MAITGGFGIELDLETGQRRQWFMGRDGVKRWSDTNAPANQKKTTPRTTIYYNPQGDDTGHRHSFTLDGTHDIDDDTYHDFLAEQCAEDWHNNKDGFEGAWPRVFSMYQEKTGPAFARFEIERETVPRFIASAC